MIREQYYNISDIHCKNKNPADLNLVRLGFKFLFTHMESVCGRPRQVEVWLAGEGGVQESVGRRLKSLSGPGPVLLQ